MLYLEQGGLNPNTPWKGPQNHPCYYIFGGDVLCFGHDFGWILQVWWLQMERTSRSSQMHMTSEPNHISVAWSNGRGSWETPLSHEAREIVSIAEPQVGWIFVREGFLVVTVWFWVSAQQLHLLQVQETLQQFRSLLLPEMEVKEGLTHNLSTVAPENKACVSKHIVKDEWILHHHVCLRLSILY